MSDYKTPENRLITKTEAAKLNKCYVEKYHDGLSAKNDSNFSSSSWYSLEDLEGYINYVKEEAKKKEISVDGIRFYFGVYPENNEDKSKVGQNTLFMCPTTSSKGLSTYKIEGNSIDVTEIQAMNYGSTGNPPKNKYGEGN